MSTRGKILLGTISLLFVCLVVWVIRTTPEPPPDQPVIDTEKKMVYDGNTLSEERNGKRIWDLTAKRMETDLKSNNTELTELVGHFYREDGKSIELKAKHGIYQQDKQEIHIDGDVVATTSDGAKLTSDRLDWQEKEDMLVASGKVKVTKDDLEATGDRIESKDAFSHFWIRGNARIVKGAKKNE